MSVYDDNEKSRSTRPRLATCFKAHMAYLHTIFSQPLLAPELETMACWHSLATGNLAEAESRCKALSELEAMSSVM